MRGENMGRRRMEREARRLTLVRLPMGAVYVPGKERTEDETLALLAASIARHGLFQPILVRACEGAQRYAVIDGERRLRACRMAGIKWIDALVFEGSTCEAAACAMEAHALRRDADWLEEAKTAAHFGKNAMLGESVLPAAFFDKRLRMLGFGERVLRAIKSARFSLEQAEPFLSVCGEERQLEAIALADERSLTPGQIKRMLGLTKVRRAEMTENAAHAILVKEAETLAARLLAKGIDVSAQRSAVNGRLCVILTLLSQNICRRAQEKEDAGKK